MNNQNYKKKKNEIKNQINILIDEYFQVFEKEKNERSSNFNFPLVVPTYGSEEVKESLEALLSTYVTMGKKCFQFEEDFANYIGKEFCIFVNSGSSANLVALSILSSPFIDNPIKPGDEIITPAVTWSTTVFPIYNIGAIPVFIDCDPNTLTININEIEEAITPRTSAIMPVHLLGNPCDMEKIMEIARKHDIYVIEDCCEAHGGKIGKEMLGSIGDISTFSFFFSHHISTIEGGAVLSNNEKFINIGRSLRAHGWTRERSDRSMIKQKFNNFDQRFLFVHPGYNLRPTEIQGAFGIHQLPKLDHFIKIRKQAALFLIEKMQKYKKFMVLPKIMGNKEQSWFGFYFIVRKDAPFTRIELVNYLEKNAIETRPIMGGNFVSQPVMDLLPYKKNNELPNSDFIFNNGIFIGLNHSMTKEKIEMIIGIFDDFFKRYL